jgi:hypothetical protein
MIGLSAIYKNCILHDYIQMHDHMHGLLAVVLVYLITTQHFKATK